MPDCEELEEDKFLNRFVTNYFTLKFNAVILIDSNFVHTLWVAETLEFILDHSFISLYCETFLIKIIQCLPIAIKNRQKPSNQ